MPGVQARGERGQTGLRSWPRHYRLLPTLRTRIPSTMGVPGETPRCLMGLPVPPPGDVWAPWPAFCKHLARSA